MLDTDVKRAEIRTDADGQRCIVGDDGTIAPIVGTLSADTTPEDFERFAKAADAWWAKHRQRQAGHLN